MTHKFHPEARQEVISAARYYSNIDSGLGIDFRNEINKAILLVIKHPEAWQKIAPKIRRCLTNRFP